MVTEARIATRDCTVAITSPEDQRVSNCQRGEADSFRPLVEQYGDVVFGTLLLMTRDREGIAPILVDPTAEPAR